jgi:hypothetical protein
MTDVKKNLRQRPACGVHRIIYDPPLRRHAGTSWTWSIYLHSVQSRLYACATRSARAAQFGTHMYIDL